MTKVAKIAVSGATYWVDRPFEYIIPDIFSDKVVVGMRVFVPFSRGNRLCEGIVLSVSESDNTQGLKSIASVLDDVPVITKDQVNLALFMRQRFFCTLYDAFKSMLPSGLWFDSSGKRKIRDKYLSIAKLSVPAAEISDRLPEIKKKAPKQALIIEQLLLFEELPADDLLRFVGAGKSSLNTLVDKGIVSINVVEYFRRPDSFCQEKAGLPSLNNDQQTVFDSLVTKFGSYTVSLLQGVTGSGKTVIYIRLIDYVLTHGKSAILLVPEISLTPQMIHTFSSYFGDEVAVLHSSLTQAERYDEWKRLNQGLAHLVIGTRSAIFAPCSNLGLVIIDEEQEDTYKSENSPRYNAIDIAKYLCFKSESVLLLGSATPNVCSRYKADIGEYSYFRLDKRYNELNLPDVRVVDLKKELSAGNDGQISSYLKYELQKNIENGEQSILFLNRRGARKIVSCPVCGFIYKCPNCSVSLTYHAVGNKLMCHYCGYTKKVDFACPDCGVEMVAFGAGTQLVEDEIKNLFPSVDVIRIDADVLNSNTTHHQVFDKFLNEKIPIMIGTQMVTKGLNFNNVTLVGVLSADQSLYSNDYRAGEKTFSLITQVIGRSGRGKKLGRAVIQTFTPENETIIQASNQDYDSFYNSEILLRKIQNSPPFCDILCITVCGKNENSVKTAAAFAKKSIEFNSSDIFDIEVLGPVPLNVVKVNNIYRYRIYIKCIADKKTRNLISDIVIDCNTNKKFMGISFFAENDPVD